MYELLHMKVEFEAGCGRGRAGGGEEALLKSVLSSLKTPDQQFAIEVQHRTERKDVFNTILNKYCFKMQSQILFLQWSRAVEETCRLYFSIFRFFLASLLK